MKIRVYILALIVLIASSEYFTGHANRLPRIDPKILISFEKSHKENNAHWQYSSLFDVDMEGDPTLESRLDQYLYRMLALAGFQYTTVRMHMLQPILLDIPPPV